MNLLEDIIELHIPYSMQALRDVKFEWHHHQPDKPIERFACSITSLDGSSGASDYHKSLGSINEQRTTPLSEMDFSTRTLHSKPYDYLFDNFDVGRSRYFLLKRTGYFPWHRDPDPSAFRIIHTIKNCTSDKLIWLLDDKILSMQDNRWYYINTKKKHCLFAFQEATFAVFGIANNEQNWMTLHKHMVN